MHSIQFDKKLPKRFYSEDPVTLAPKLLGKFFVRKQEEKYLVGKIVEVEAYRGKDDKAAHSYNGKTKRTEVMFFEGGYIYVYFTYGMHYCANVVCGKKDEGAAVLIRGVEPVDNIKIMSKNRFNKLVLSDKEKINLTNGPAKFCQSFGITKEQNGLDLTGETIFLIDNKKINKNMVVQTTRIGIKKSVDLRWRFYIKNNPYVSKK